MYIQPEVSKQPPKAIARILLALTIFTTCIGSITFTLSFALFYTVWSDYSQSVEIIGEDREIMTAMIGIATLSILVPVFLGIFYAIRKVRENEMLRAHRPS